MNSGNVRSRLRVCRFPLLCRDTRNPGRSMGKRVYEDGRAIGLPEEINVRIGSGVLGPHPDHDQPEWQIPPFRRKAYLHGNGTHSSQEEACMGYLDFF
jgi:hypothetical protein